MKKFLPLLLLTATACDDPFVLENIDVATCAWLPSWMADCTSPEVHDKALDVLQFGLVESKVTCRGVPNHAPSGCRLMQNGSGTYVAHRLVDGSAFVTLEQQAFLLGRVEREAQTMSVAHPLFPLDTWSVSDGELIVHKNGCRDVVVDLESECSGYNLSALSN
jgi:hypothetical protein